MVISKSFYATVLSASLIFFSACVSVEWEGSYTYSPGKYTFRGDPDMTGSNPEDKTDAYLQRLQIGFREKAGTLGERLGAGIILEGIQSDDDLFENEASMPFESQVNDIFRN